MVTNNKPSISKTSNVSRHYHHHIRYVLEHIIDKFVVVSLFLLLAIIIIEFFFHDIANAYHGILTIADFFIIAIFCIDLILKYLRVRNVPLFLKRYWLEIIAIFPFYLIFRVAEVFSFIRPISESVVSMESVQLIFHESVEIEREGARLVKEAGSYSRFSRLYKFIRPICMMPRFLKLAVFFEHPPHHSMVYSKKAASPFYATIILLIVALLAGFAMVFVDVSIISPTSPCDHLDSIKLVSSFNNPSLCIISSKNQIQPTGTEVVAQNNTISFMIQNTAPESVNGLHITIFDLSTPKSIKKNTNSTNAAPNLEVFTIRDYNAYIESAGTISRRYDYPANLKNVTRVQIAFYRKIKDRLFLCPDHAITVSEVPFCK